MTLNIITKTVAGALLAGVAIAAGVAVAHAAGNPASAAIDAPIAHPDYDALTGMDLVEAGQYVGAYGYGVIEDPHVTGIEPPCGAQPTGLIAVETSEGRVIGHTVIEELAVRAC